MAGDHRNNTHAHDLDGAVGTSAAKVMRWSTVACGVLVVLGAIVLWPGDRSGGGDPLGLAADPADARVTAVNEGACASVPESVCQIVTFDVNSGDHAGSVGTIETFGSGDFSTGDRIRVIASTDTNGQMVYSFFDFERSTPMLILLLLFVVAVIVLGRWRGLGAIAGLAGSLFVIVMFALPSLVDGNNAIAVALVTAGAVAIVALYLAHGVTAATDVALLSTFASLVLTGALAWIFVRAGHLTGFTDDATFTLDALGTGIDPRGILLAGIVIGSLGVLDDVTVTQVSAVGELHRARPDSSRRDLFVSALRIGRDHVSSTVNTLFLAYAGATLPLLLLFSEINESVSSVATREIVATEIVRAVVGSIGLVASVPISTWLAIQVLPSNRAAPLRSERGASWREQDPNDLNWGDDHL